MVDSVLSVFSVVRPVMIAIVFQQPAWLWGLLLCVVPIAIHLLLRRRPRLVPWTGMRFLPAARRKSWKWIQLQRWLQLLTRIVLIACLVLAVADPRLESALEPVSLHRPMHRLLIADTSMSMRAQHAGRTAFERMQKAAEAILQHSSAGDFWQLLQHGNPDYPIVIAEPTLDSDAMRLELQSLKPTWQPGQWDESIRSALELLKKIPEDSQVEVIILTDLQRSEWDKTDELKASLRESCRRLSRRSHLSIVDCGNPHAGNLALVDLQVIGSDPVHNQSIDLVVAIHRYLEGPLECQLDLLVDEQPVSQKQIELKKDLTTHVKFSVPMSRTTDHLVEVRLSPDALLEDNRMWRMIPAQHELNIVSVGSLSERGGVEGNDFLALAIAPSSGETKLTDGPQRFQFHSVPENQLSEIDFAETDVVILNNVSSVTPLEASALFSYVQAGGGLLIVMGENVDATAMNQQFGKRGVDLLPATLLDRTEPLLEDDPPFTFVPAIPDHPVIAAFARHPEAGLSAVHVNRYQKTELLAIDSELERVIDFSSGDPMLVFRQVGAGRTALCTAAMNGDWGNWVLSPSFVPILQETLNFLSAVNRNLAVTRVTQSVDLPELSDRFQWTCQRQDGAIFQGTSESGAFAATAEPFAQPGAYEVFSESFLHGRQIVIRDCDPADSNLSRLSSEDLKSQWFRGQRVRMTTDVSTRESATLTQEEIQQTSVVSRRLLLAVLVCGLIDLILAQSAPWAGGLLRRVRPVIKVR